MKEIKIGTATLIYGDCEEYMAGLSDKSFDLAIVDPPYGIKRFEKGSLRFDKENKYKNGLSWDRKPSDDMFNKLFNVSYNQIIFGANNFVLPPSEYFLIWNKLQTVDNFASAEYAWVSMGLKKPAKVFEYGIHQHNSDVKKIHPTQKPVKLYEWLLANYAKPGQTILDTHGGSMSSVIAAINMGFEITCIEKDEDYFNAAVERVIISQQQLKLF